MECNPLMQLAALKGRFMEQLAKLCFPNQPTFPDTAFLAGPMSPMPVALGIAMKDLLDQIDVAPRLRQALQGRTGEECLHIPTRLHGAPQSREAATTLPRAALQSRHAGTAIFARPEFRFDRRAPEIGRVARRRRTLRGGPSDQGIQIGLRALAETAPVFEQLPAQALEGRIRLLLDAPGLVHRHTGICATG